MKLNPINSENINDAWDLFQALIVEQGTKTYATIDFEGFKASFLKPQLTTMKGLIGYDKGRPIALATYCYSFSIYRGQPVLTFKTFYVLPDERRNGYGRQMLKFLCEEAEKGNCAFIQWSVYVENEFAQSYYTSLGLNSDEDLLDYVVSPKKLKERLS